MIFFVRKIIYIWAFVLLMSGFLSSINAQTTAKNYKFSNGQWFDGKNFKRKTFYSENGVFTLRPPSKIDETIDLKNGFVIPPFGDAHTHNLDGTRDLERLSKVYLEEGTFYVQVLGNYATGAKQARPLINKPATLDVIYANGMLTSTYGHPFTVYEPLAMGIYDPREAFRRIDEVKKSRRAENNAYWFLDTKADADAKWEKILATAPDIIKISLIDVKDFEKYADTDEALNKGLSPEVAEYVVKKARQAGLRVFAHIETADDFRFGVKIGVDGFTHAPYYGWDGKEATKPQDELTEQDFKLAAEKNIVVIPTAGRSIFSVTDYAPDGKSNLDKERFARIIQRQKKQFNLMVKHGVKIALGFDIYGSSNRPEILHFYDHEIFDNRTLLKIAVEKTPQTIFPNRRIGKLSEGYEASFLVLEGNPLVEFDQIKNIRMRFKQGAFIK